MAHVLDLIAKYADSDLPKGPGRPGVVAGTASQDHLERKKMFQVLGVPADMDPTNALGNGAPTAPVPAVTIYDEKPVHRTMVLMRARGCTYKEIAEATDYSQQQVRQVCNQPWARQRLSQLAMDGQMDVQDILAAELLPSIEAIVEIRDDKKAGASTRLAAANALLDRFLGKPTVTVNNNNTNRTVGANESLEEIEANIQRVREEQVTLAGKPAVRQVQITVTETRSQC